MLAKNIQPAQFEVWKKSLEAYWLASRFYQCSPKEQVAYLRSLVDEGLMLNVEFEIGPTTPLFPNAENPEQISVSELLERECLLKHPIVSRRYEMFRMTHSLQHTLTEFISLLHQASINAQLTDLDANGFIAF